LRFSRFAVWPRLRWCVKIGTRWVLRTRLDPCAPLKLVRLQDIVGRHQPDADPTYLEALEVLRKALEELHGADEELKEQAERVARA